MEIPHLQLLPSEDRLVVSLTNPGPQQLRIWQDDNTWGWFALSFETQGPGTAVSKITKKPITWTRNGPGFDLLGPNASKTWKPDLNREEWEHESPAYTHPDQQIRAVYEVSETHESSQLQVFTGRLVSSWIQMPQHT